MTQVTLIVMMNLVNGPLVALPIGPAGTSPASPPPVRCLGLAALGFGMAVRQLCDGASLMFSPFVARTPRSSIRCRGTRHRRSADDVTIHRPG
jgi:hypothetical protein